MERASKEVAIEALLNTFEEVWLSRQLELVPPERHPPAITREEVLLHTYLMYSRFYYCVCYADGIGAGAGRTTNSIHT